MLFLGIAAIGPPAVLAQNHINPTMAPPYRVLMIFRESKDLPGNVRIEQVTRTEMQAHAPNPVEFYSEHLDVSRFSDEDHYRIFRDFIGAKYAGLKLNLVMVFMAQDFTLAEQLPAALFPELPVVFVAANELSVPPFGNRRITGIVQRFDLEGTLDLITTLQPDVRRVVVIGGTSEADRLTLTRIARASEDIPGLELEFWTNRPAAELPQSVATLRKDSAILLSTVYRDTAGQSFYLSQLAGLLAPRASVPLYVLGGGAIGSGALGGSVIDPERLGVRAGQLALKILQGTPPDAVPVEIRTNGMATVDWRALRRFGISESRVPPDCSVRYRPNSLWIEHKAFILTAAAVFLAQGMTIAALLVQRAKRRRAEAEIQTQRTELAHVARVSTMGQMASALAHELNQPLGAILRNAEAAELFLQKTEPDLKEIGAILEDIRKDDRRAGGVIERMRSFLKRQSLEHSPVEIRGLLEETVELARPDARIRRVKLSLEAPVRLPVVQGDRIHLQQVILNLLLNGMDAMNGCPEGERLVSVCATQRLDGYLEVAVTDSGLGIPADNLAKLFDPFFTTKSTGMGMGLAISRSIIEAHGGKIRATNNAGRGASFTFSLPARKTAKD